MIELPRASTRRAFEAKLEQVGVRRVAEDFAKGAQKVGRRHARLLRELRNGHAFLQGAVDLVARAAQALERNDGRQVHRARVSPAARELVKAVGA